MKKYVIAIDQGTTSSRVIVVNRQGDIVYKEQMEVAQILDNNQVLQNPLELFQSVDILLKRIFSKYQIDPNDVSSMGITNQRETTILWNKKSGKIIHQAISWQSKHTNNICESWIKKGFQTKVKEKTGLMIHPYFSASKLHALLKMTNDHQDLLFGTVDTYLLWRMTGEHKTDVTNASRTMLYNIHTHTYDQELLHDFEIPKHILPQVCDNDHHYGDYEIHGVKIPIMTMIGDQQASLFGHQCFVKGSIKNTYGTGCFALMNTGKNVVISKKGLLSTIAWRLQNETTYALEGSVFMGGAIMKWLKQLKLIDQIKESESLANHAKNDLIYLIPAFVGLGTPYWQTDVKGAIFGLTIDTSPNDIIKAALQSIAFQVKDLIRVMEDETGIPCHFLSVDGGASDNGYLLSFQADILQTNLIVTSELETTALGAAYLAGLATHFFKNMRDIEKNRPVIKTLYPKMSADEAFKRYQGWQSAVLSLLNYEEPKI